MPDCLRASVDNGPFLVFLESESEPEHGNRRFKPSTYILTGEQGEQYVRTMYTQKMLYSRVKTYFFPHKRFIQNFKQNYL